MSLSLHLFPLLLNLFPPPKSQKLTNLLLALIPLKRPLKNAEPSKEIEPSPSNPPTESPSKEPVKHSAPTEKEKIPQKTPPSTAPEPNKKHYEIHIEEDSDTVPRRILTQPASLPILKHAGKPVEKKEEQPEPPRRKTADEIVGIYDTSTLSGLMEAIKQRKDDSE